MSSPGASGSAPRTVKLRNHHLTLRIQPESGRILEVESLASGNHLVSWWPFKIRVPDRAGGIGETSAPAGAAPFECEEGPGFVRLTRDLPGGMVLEEKITLPADSLVFTVSVRLRNDSESVRTYALAEGAAVCPGFGGPCPRPESGISNCRQKAFTKRSGEEPRQIDYEVFESLRREHDDLQWVVFADPVSNDSLAVVLPPGHVVIRTEYHWWLEWTKTVTLSPGASYSADIHFAATGALNMPVLADEHFVAGFAGDPRGVTDLSGGHVHVYGLLPSSAGNPVSVSASGKEIVRDKPLGDGREPLVVPLPERSAGGDVELQVSVGAKFGQVRLSGQGVAELLALLDGECRKARSLADSGAISKEKAATVIAMKRIGILSLDLAPGAIESRLEGLLENARAVLASPLEAMPFYTEAEEALQRQIASDIDLDAEARILCDALAASYDLSKPRFRHEGPGAFALAPKLLQAALYLSQRHDDEVLALFRARLSEMTALWARFGEILYETIHHGCLLCLLAPAAKIASASGLLDDEQEVEVQAMIMDLAAKIKRRGGMQPRLSNWWAMEDSALSWVGALFPYLPYADSYMEMGRETFYWLLAHGTLDDGAFWEMSPSYHMVTLKHLWHIAEAFRRKGQDYFAREVGGKRIGLMCRYVKSLAVLPGRLPAFDDSHGLMSPETMLALAKRLGDAELAWHADAAFAQEGTTRGLWDLFVPVRTPGPAEAVRRSHVLGPSGRLVMRSFCRNITVVVEYGPHGGWHGHNDKLSFELYWRDVCLSPDAGCYLYEDALHWDWFKTARAHNTVTIGERDQVPSAGSLEHFNEALGCTMAAVIAPTYPGVVHRREITMGDRTILVDDFLEGATHGEMMVWRMNSRVPFQIESGAALFERDGVTVRITPVTEGVTLEAAEVPLAGEGPGGGIEAGWQLRISRPISHGSERLQVRIDLSW